MEKAMATHSSTLAWKIPRTEEPGRLQSMGLHRVGHHWSDLAAAAAAIWYKVVHACYLFNVCWLFWILEFLISIFVVVQSLSCICLFVTHIDNLCLFSPSFFIVIWLVCRLYCFLKNQLLVSSNFLYCSFNFYVTESTYIFFILLFNRRRRG